MYGLSGPNTLTFKDSFPLRNIRELIDKLSGCSRFRSLDMLSGYNGTPTQERCIQKTACIVNDELLAFPLLRFRLCDAPATFQRILCSALIGLRHSSSSYLDDVLMLAENNGVTILESVGALREMVSARPPHGFPAHWRNLPQPPDSEPW